MDDHLWPLPGEHLWSNWLTNTGLPRATQYRYCLHPDCKAVEYREAPKA